MSKINDIARGVYYPDNKSSWADVGGNGYWTNTLAPNGSTSVIQSTNRWVSCQSGLGYLPHDEATGSAATDFVGTSSWWFKEAWVNNYRGGGIDLSGNYYLRGENSHDTSHKYHYFYKSTRNTYVHFFPQGDTGGASIAEFRVKSNAGGAAYRTLSLNGSGTITWNGSPLRLHGESIGLEEVSTGATREGGEEETLADIIQDLQSEVLSLRKSVQPVTDTEILNKEPLMETIYNLQEETKTAKDELSKIHSENNQLKQDVLILTQSMLQMKRFMLQYNQADMLPEIPEGE